MRKHGDDMSSSKKKKTDNAVLRAVEEAKKRQDAVRSLFGDEIIAPVGQQVSATPTSTQTQDNELLSAFNKWLEYQKNNISSAGEAIANTFSPVAKAFGQNDTEAWYRGYIDPKRFDDGYDFGDVTMSILGTGVDAAADFAAGTGEAVESILDGMSFAGMKMAEYMGAKYLSRLEDAILNQITGNNYSYMEDKWDETQKEVVDFVKGDFIPTDQFQEAAKQGLGYDWEQDSVLGEKSDALVQSVPPIVASLIAQSHGVPWWLVSYANAFGGKSEQALNEGATTDEAFINAAITAFGEIATEKISSGILPGGGKSLDDIVTKTISKIPNKTARGFVKFFIDGLGEGLEEVLSEDISTIADGVTHKRDGDLWEMLFSEEAVKRKAEAALGGFILGGGSNVINTVKTSRQGRDTVTGLTANEETVVQAETERRAAEYKADGKKANIDKIRAEVIEAMKRGDISLEAIESYLGGEVYRRYTEAKTKQKGIQEELKRAAATIDALYGKGDLTEQEQAELDKAVQSIGNLSAQEKALKVDDARQNLHEYVNNLTKTQGDAYLRGRYEGFNTDKVYRAKNKKNQAAVDATIESAKKAGLNNTRRVHDLVDFAAKISADTGLVFNLSNSKRIKDAFVQRQTADIQKLEAIPEAERTAAQKKTLEEMRELLAKVKSGDITINGTNSGNMITLNLGSPDPLNRIAGHEISHSLENAKAYDALRDSLLAYAKSKGVDTDKMLGEYRKRYQGANNADAEREMIADMVGDYLFSDEDFVKHLTKNRNLFQRVYDEIKYLLKLATTGSQEARELERVKHLFDKAYKQMASANADTGTQYSFSSMSHTFFGNEDMSTLDWKKADYKSTEGYQAYVDKCVNNIRQSRPDFDEQAARQEVERSIDGIVRVAIAAKEAGFDILDSGKTRDVKDSKNRLLFSSLEPNSDYITSSDISTICDKRKNFAEIYDDIVRAEEKMGVPKEKRFFSNVDNYFYIHQVMAEKGLTTPCRECYVESMRKNLAPMANAFMELVNETDGSNKANAQLYHQKGKDKGKLKVGNAETREFVLAALEEYGMTPGDLSIEKLSSAKGLAELKIKAPKVYEAFNSFYGQSKPKMPRSATPFRFGELTALLTDDNGKINKKLVEKINHTGGFRLQSYSDFQVENFTDVLQVLFEAGTLGLKGHAYTKVPAFLEATDNTNLKRNISIFMYKDGNQWKLDRNDSFPYTLEEIYKLVDADKSGNTGIIAVSQNAEMSAWIMANDHIGYGIPYHKSGQKMDVVRSTVVRENGREIKGYSEAKDHTRQQSEVWAKANSDHKALTKVKKGIDIYEFWDFDNQAGLSKTQLIEKNVKDYLDACEKAGYLPKFREYVLNNQKVLEDVLRYSKELGFATQDATIDDISFRHEVRDANGKLVRTYRVPYGYYKFLGDFGMFTPDGKASPQKTLSLEDYDFDKAVDFFADAETLRRNEILQQFANGKLREQYRNSDLTTEELEQLAKRKRDEVVREVVGDDIAPVSYSLSENPQKLDADYTDAVNRGDMDTAQRLVDEAAKKAGFPVRLLHGTQKFGFTVPDTSMSDDKLSFFATNEVDTAKTYSSLPGKRRIAEDANYDDIESENEALDEAARDGAYDLAHAISSWAGYYGAADADFIYDEFDRIANAGDGVAITGTADGDMYEVADEIIANLYDEDLHDGMEFWEWQETDEGEDLYTKVNKTIAKFLAKYEFDTNAQRSGNYDLYANTDGLLVIEGNGAKWDDIKSDILPDITSDEGKKYGYRGHWDKWTTRSISKYASDNGYRGVLFKNIYDDGGRSSSGVRKPADVYSFFYPQEQVKSADPVTYDDSGNVIPLSQRFNPNNNDIRYSLSDSTAPLAPMNNFDTFGKDLKRDGYSSDIAPVKAETRQNIAPVQYSMTENGGQKPVVDHIREKMEKDLAKLRERYEPQIEKYKGMADSKEETIGKLAWQLLSELQTMEKGKKVSWDLGYLLDHTVKEAADYRSLDIALKNIRDNPLEVVNPRSKAERFARQMLERQWQEMLDYASDLEQEYRQSIEDLATQANQELDAATGKPVAPIAQNSPAGRDVAPVAPTSQEVTEEKKAPTIDRVMANDGPKAKQKKSSLVMKLRNALVDKGSVIDDISIKTGNPELIARYKSINNAAAKAQHMIGNGDAKSGVKALTEIQKNVKKVASEAEFDDYMYNRLNVDRMTMMTRYPGRHDIPVFGPEYSAAESRANVQAYEAKHPEFRGLANDVYAFVRNNLNLMIQEGLITQETAKLWGEMYPHYIPIERASFQDKHTHQDGRTGAYNPVKKLTGSEKELRPMFTAIADQTIAVQKAIAKNRFGKELRRMLNGVEARETASTGPADGILQDGTIVYSDARGINGKVTGYDESRNQYSVQFKYDNGRTEEVWMNPEQVSQMAPDTAMDEAMRGFFDSKDLLKPAKGEENPIFTVFENGKRIEFEITPDIYDALKPTSDAMSAKIPVLSQLTNARKRILTDLNPVFWLTNTPKDIQAILPNSKHPASTAKELAKLFFAWGKSKNRSQWYNEYIENGGKQQSYFNEEERRLEKEPGTAKRILTGPARFIRSINENLEMLPRLAEYIASRKKGASIDVAMLDAARVTTDFSAAGDFSRMLNRNFVPFLTASISGSAQQVRNFREAKAKGAKGIAGYIMRQAIATIPLAVFNHLMWEDDEEYAELSDYVKQNYYIVRKTDDGKFIRIPKGREVAVIQDFYEQMANLVTGNFDDVDVGSFAQLAMTNIAPNNPIDNNILAPIIQAHTGKTWYGDDLIPSRLQKVPNAEQYDESTDAISKWIGEMTGMSPYRINYILDQYSGGFGDVILPMLTSEAESGTDTIGGKLLAPLADKFTVDSTMKNQYVSDFYDKVDELEINSNSQNATDEDALMYAYMSSKNSEIGTLYGLKRKVNSAVTVGDLQDIAEELKPFLDSSTDPGLWYAMNYGNQNTKITDSSKYQIVRAIQRRIDDRAKKALETYESVSLDGGYATIGSDHFVKKEDSWKKLSTDEYNEQKLMTKAMGIRPDTYWNAKWTLSGFRNDKDENGDTIDGTRKQKITDWINSQDIPYEAKIMLYKSMYTGYRGYDTEIIQYLRTNPDISYEQMVEILEKLGFKIN